MTCFVLPQIMASAWASIDGAKAAQKNGVSLGNWRAVTTMMIGRLTEHKALDVQAERSKIEMSWQDKHWFGFAVFKRAYHLLTEGGFASKLLACSMRGGPLVAGKLRFWDVEKISGADIVYTCPPYGLELLFQIGEGLDLRRGMDDEGPLSAAPAQY